MLNKIDTLWDELSTPEQVEEQIQRQKAETAKILGIQSRQVIAVSAQKGLVGKVTKDKALLEKSCLGLLEDALGGGMLQERQRILQLKVSKGIADLRNETGRVINIRKRDLTEQKLELQGLQGKNVGVIKHMRSRIAKEQADFDQGGAKIHAVRSVHLKLLNEVFAMLGNAVLKSEMQQLTDVLNQKGLKLGVKKSYGEAFERLRANFAKVQALTTEMHTMLAAMFKQLNAEYGFSLQTIAEPDLAFYLKDLELAHKSHLQYLGISNIFKLAQTEFVDRLVRALFSRVRVINEVALGEIELWSKAAAAQLDAQLRERHRAFARRIEAVDRIQQASGGLEEHILEINQQEESITTMEAKLVELTAHLLVEPPVSVTEVDLEII